MKQKETKPVKTGIAELDKQIGGGLEPGSVTVLYGHSGVISIFWRFVMAANVQATSKSKFLRIMTKKDIDISTLRAINQTTKDNRLVVLLTFGDTRFVNRNDLPSEVKDIVENVFFLDSVCTNVIGKYRSILEVQKNRLYGLHNAKFGLLREYDLNPENE